MHSCEYEAAGLQENELILLGYVCVGSLPRLPQQLLVPNLHRTQNPESGKSDSAMDSQGKWRQLEKCITMQAACEDGEAIFGLDKDVLMKQKELKTILMIYELEEEDFQGVNIDMV